MYFCCRLFWSFFFVCMFHCCSGTLQTWVVACCALQNFPVTTNYIQGFKVVQSLFSPNKMEGLRSCRRSGSSTGVDTLLDVCESNWRCRGGNRYFLHWIFQASFIRHTRSMNGRCLISKLRCRCESWSHHSRPESWACSYDAITQGLSESWLS